MRYPATEKLEIIRLVERSHLPVRRTLDKLGVPRPTFYRWYDLYRRFGDAGLEDRQGGPRRVWNRVPETVRGQVLDLALEQPELSPRELAVTFTDTKAQFISEASVYRLLKAADVTETLEQALSAAGLDRSSKAHRPRLLSDNGSSYIARDLAAWLKGQGITHVRGAHNHPMTQGKIKR